MQFLLCIPLVLLLLFMPGNGGTPFNEPSPLLPSDGAPLREDSPPADLDSKQEKNNSQLIKETYIQVYR